ncbi:5-guanidino-2-oxopentanoate decarboxylase [Dongia deserti]|uniref:5-guanidino-2-oxopentanoate decarboxylase n=1 Tax=Dongia deserti TaxID=2268030 RepID=UPI000E653A55|nr:5-guanidino-2-oxopentanoate decarboxylase [Dongia deserti]
MTNQNCGQAAITLLERYGVDTVFGMPGVHTLEFYRGLVASKIRHIAVRHEQGAGFMADGYARASGRPGVCILISGPGLTNAATPIGQAYSDSIPMLILSSVNATEDLGKGRGRLHEITSQQTVIAPLTAFSRTVYKAEDLPAAYADAYRIFEAGRPRPVHVEVPLDVLAGPAPALADRPPSVLPLMPDGSLVEEACALISKARRPVIVAGGGIIDHGPALTALAEQIGAPVIPTIAAKGAMSNRHPLCVDATLSLPQTQAFLRSADLVIAVGTELGGEADCWIDRLPIEGKLIRIDIDAAALTRDYPPDVAIHADGGATLAALAQSVGSSRSQIGAVDVARLRAEIRNSLPSLQRKHMLILEALREALPRDGIVATDMTQLAYSGSYHFPCEQPRCWFHPVGYGTLGYGLPAAIGAQLAQPHRATVAIVGDGGLLFTVQELATAVELGLPVAVVLWNNNALGQIAEGMKERGITEIGVRPRNPDFIKLAEAFGCRTAQPSSIAAFKAALESAFKADRPTLIEMREDAVFLGG